MISALKLHRNIWIPLAVHTALFILVVTGILPRGVVPYWTLALLTWAAVVPARVSVPFFAAAIPLFIAIPVTANFDNLTMSRPLAIVIFLRWFLSSFDMSGVREGIRSLFSRLRSSYRVWPIGSALFLLGLFALLSLTRSTDMTAGIRRIIYFANALLVPVVLYYSLKRDADLGRKVVAAIAYSAIAITFVAFVQLASTYLIDIYQFMQVWGEGIQLRQFGTLWSTIAIRLGNTWFAYYGAQLSLRIFSLFPDSHSFPLYGILSLAAFFAYSVRTLMTRARSNASFWSLLKTRANLGVLWIPIALLAIILSGTRGIWAAAVGLPVVVAVIWFLLKRRQHLRPLWLWLSSFLVVFVFLFAIAYPIFVSPQFLLSKGDFGLFRERIRSIIDLGETSNAQRIEIWSATLTSIKERPLLGVGIGNFPVVLDQQVFLARAGSTAHNIYLHIAAEMGLLALAAWIWLWITLYRYTFRRFVEVHEPFWQGYYGWLLLAIPWVAAYLLTDAALFDERTLLLFGVTAALIAARPAFHHD